MEFEAPFHSKYSPSLLYNISNTGYSTSDLISRVFTKCPLNLTPEELKSGDEKILNTFLAKANFNNFLYINNGILIAHIKFWNNFNKSMAMDKTKKAADFYPDWFKICCHLKYLFSELEEEGLRLFKLFSSLSNKYNEKESEVFWEKCKPKYGSIPRVFSIIGKPKAFETKMPDRREIVKNNFF